MEGLTGRKNHRLFVLGEMDQILLLYLILCMYRVL